MAKYVYGDVDSFHRTAHHIGREGNPKVEILSVQNVSFSYPEEKQEAVNNVTFSVEKGDFVVLCGSSGSGKSTLLRLLKYDIAPHGTIEGKVRYKSLPIEDYSLLERSKEIGMVFQNPDNQMVMDTVMDELLFGLENMNISTAEMRKKIAEMVHFFDLGNILTKKTEELSGGQKQMINLASVLLLDPDVLLLDEPTAQLDPIAAKNFITTLHQLNEEFGMTIIIAEHRLEELFSIANKVVILEEGTLIHTGETKKVIGELADNSRLKNYLPTASQLYLSYKGDIQHNEIPLNVKEAKQWLEQQTIVEKGIKRGKREKSKELLQLNKIDYQYTRYAPRVLNNLSLSIHERDIHAVLGSNGSGKSTLLKIISGILKPQHGKIEMNGKKLKAIDPKRIGYLPQNPELFFLHDTLWKEYMTIAEAFEIQHAEEYVNQLLHKFQLTPFKDRHPYDLSGGQLQKAALLGSLIVKPRILLIDEPTKGLDPDSKKHLGSLLQDLTREGVTIVMVTHDVEFAASYATKCSMLFQGQITITEDTESFFRGNLYYTTVMNRITRKLDLPPVITLKEAQENWDVQEIL